MKDRPKVHYEYEERACDCGDSYCGECREVVSKIACRAATRSSTERSRDVTKITCAGCCRSRVYGKAQKAEYERVVLQKGPDALTLAQRENARLREELTKAREMVKRYIVAQGPHLYPSWREALIKDCGLVVDSIGFVTVPPIGGDK